MMRKRTNLESEVAAGERRDAVTRRIVVEDEAVAVHLVQDHLEVSEV